MIIDTIAHAARYRNAWGNLFRQGFDWLETFEHTTPSGRYPIVGDDVYALVQSYVSTDPAAKLFEAHLRFCDLHYVVSGEENLWLAKKDSLQVSREYHEIDDVTLFTGGSSRGGNCVRLGVGDFAIFFPGEIHKPGCRLDASAEVVKIVIKLRFMDF